MFYVKEVIGDNASSREIILEWHRRFPGCRKDLEYDESPTRPATARTVGKVLKIIEIVRKDRGLSIRMITDMVNTNKER